MEKGFWSDDGDVFYLDGLAWGVAPDGRTICMGLEEEILKRHQAKHKPPARIVVRAHQNNKGLVPKVDVNNTVPMGRPPIPADVWNYEILLGEGTLRKKAERLGVGKSTVARKIKELKNEPVP